PDWRRRGAEGAGRGGGGPAPHGRRHQGRAGRAHQHPGLQPVHPAVPGLAV
ncbi:unnamed protein product, partial [Prorocentrum cordatum]